MTTTDGPAANQVEAVVSTRLLSNNGKVKVKHCNDDNVICLCERPALVSCLLEFYSSNVLCERSTFSHGRNRLGTRITSGSVLLATFIFSTHSRVFSFLPTYIPNDYIVLLNLSVQVSNVMN